MLVLFLVLIGIITSIIEIEIRELDFVLKEKDLLKKEILEKLNFYIEIKLKIFEKIKIISIGVYKKKSDYEIILKLLGIKINITKIIMRIHLKQKIFKRPNNFISYMKKLNITHSKTKLKVIFGIEDVFLTSISIPIITNIIIYKLIKNNKNEIPKLEVLPSYNQKFSLEIYLNTVIKFYKILNIFIKQRKNNKEKTIKRRYV